MSASPSKDEERRREEVGGIVRGKTSIRATHIGTVSARTHTLSHTRYRLVNIHTEALINMNWVGIGRGEGGAMGVLSQLMSCLDRYPNHCSAIPTLMGG